MAFTNFHGHCAYCDGKETPEAFIREAVRQRMPVYGFSSHAPLPFDLPWPMRAENTEKYIAAIESLKHTYAGQIEIYTGLEVDYIPQIAGPGQPSIRQWPLDYTIGSVHFVDFFPEGRPWEIDGLHQVFLKGLEEIFQHDIEKAIRRYYALLRQMVQEDPPDVIGHLDKIKIQSEEGQLFSEEAKWYREAVEETLEVIAQSGIIVEVNTRGIYKKKSAEPYPSYWILEKIKAKNIPIMLNADAHHPQEITACFEEVAARLQAIGFEQFRLLRRGVWQDVAFNTQGIQDDES